MTDDSPPDAAWPGETADPKPVVMCGIQRVTLRRSISKASTRQKQAARTRSAARVHRLAGGRFVDSFRHHPDVTGAVTLIIRLPLPAPDGDLPEWRIDTSWSATSWLQINACI